MANFGGHNSAHHRLPKLSVAKRVLSPPARRVLLTARLLRQLGSKNFSYFAPVPEKFPAFTTRTGHCPLSDPPLGRSELCSQHGGADPIARPPGHRLDPGRVPAMGGGEKPGPFSSSLWDARAAGTSCRSFAVWSFSCFCPLPLSLQPRGAAAPLCC